MCPIVGVRWKCANCPDMDLCDACEKKVKHQPSHVWLKIKQPVSLNSSANGKKPLLDNLYEQANAVDKTKLMFD